MEYDVLIIGGGITGAGVLRDCALRGFKTICIEKAEPGQATTAASTHLIHGGIRYLLYDRLTTHTTAWDAGNIMRIAGDMLKRIPIVWPLYKGQKYGAEIVETLIKAYEPFQRMKGGLPHLRLNAEETTKLIPGLKTEGLRGAVSFDEYWVDAPRLVERNIAAGEKNGGLFKKNTTVTGLIIEEHAVKGVRIKNTSGGEEEIRAKIVVNAAGPWIDKITRMAGIETPLHLRKGTHLVYDKPLVPTGLLVEAIDASRLIFILPFPGGTLVGPTDIPSDSDPDSTRTDPEETEYLLASVRRYFTDFPDTYKSTTVGARPILGHAGNEKLLSREYEIIDHASRHGISNFITLGGGKLSNFRLMAMDGVDVICRKLHHAKECTTHKLTLDGEPIASIPDFPRPWRQLKKFLRQHPRLRELYTLMWLGFGLASHILRLVISGKKESTAEAFKEHYGLTAEPIHVDRSLPSNWSKRKELATRDDRA